MNQQDAEDKLTKILEDRYDSIITIYFNGIKQIEDVDWSIHDNKIQIPSRAEQTEVKVYRVGSTFPQHVVQMAPGDTLNISLPEKMNGAL